MIRGIIFDCFGVLYGGSLEYLVSLAPAERMRDVTDINKQKDYGFITLEEYLDQIGAIINRTPDEVREIMQQRHVRNPELVDYVRELKSQYKIGLLSNIGDSMFNELFTPEEAEELFDEVLLSYREALAKPNPAVFTLIAERLGLAPGECVMIDDIEENCDGAEIAGMQSIQHITNDGTRSRLAQLLRDE